MILVEGGTVLTPGGWEQTNVLIDGSRVVSVGGSVEGETVVDASGCLVGPGFVDLHAHLREPGQTWKEDIASGSRAAAAGGFTAIVAMPNTDPPIDSPKVVAEVVASGTAAGLVDVVPAAALTVGRAGATPSAIDDLYAAGVRVFSDDGDSVTDPVVLATVMAAVAGTRDGVVAQHAEDPTLTREGHMHEGEVSRALGIAGLPAAAETDVIARDLRLAAKAGVHYHCQHVSSMMTLDVIRQAKADGVAVTAEVTPHHLTFDDTAVDGRDSDFKMYPPLRSPHDRAALIEALRDGTIDAVATDHAPHSTEEKAVAFTDAPRGVIGLETAAAATWEVLGDRSRFFEVLSMAPARIAGLADHGRPVAPGVFANLVVFDPRRRWLATSFVSRSSNTPYQGHEMLGEVRATIYRGKLVHQTGANAA